MKKYSTISWKLHKYPGLLPRQKCVGKGQPKDAGLE